MDIEEFAYESPESGDDNINEMGFYIPKEVLLKEAEAQQKLRDDQNSYDGGYDSDFEKKRIDQMEEQINEANESRMNNNPLLLDKKKMQKESKKRKMLEQQMEDFKKEKVMKMSNSDLKAGLEDSKKKKRGEDGDSDAGYESDSEEADDDELASSDESSVEQYDDFDLKKDVRVKALKKKVVDEGYVSDSEEEEELKEM